MTSSSHQNSARMTSSAVAQTVSILAVDNIAVSDFAKDLLNRCVQGEITVEEAREAIRQRARAYAAKTF